MVVVTVTVDHIDLANPREGRVPLVAYRDEQDSVREAVRAWAQVREFAGLIDRAREGGQRPR